MSKPVKPTPAERRQQAIELVAAGKLTSEQIAEKVGTCRRTITTWKADKEFQAAVKQQANAWRQKARTQGIADKDVRLKVLNDLHNRLQVAMRKRGADPEHQDVPGYETGMVTVTYKMRSLGEGAGSEAVREYKIDTETPAAIEDVLEKAAIERGHRDPKKKDAGAAVSYAEYVVILNAGRDRVAAAKAKPFEPRNRVRSELQPGS